MTIILSLIKKRKVENVYFITGKVNDFVTDKLIIGFYFLLN